MANLFPFVTRLSWMKIKGPILMFSNAPPQTPPNPAGWDLPEDRPLKYGEDKIWWLPCGVLGQLDGTGNSGPVPGSWVHAALGFGRTQARERFQFPEGFIYPQGLTAKTKPHQHVSTPLHGSWPRILGQALGVHPRPQVCRSPWCISGGGGSS